MSGFTLRIRGGRAGLSALRDSDSASNFLLDDAGSGAYTGITLNATHPRFVVSFVLLDSSGGKFELEAITNRVMTVVPLAVGTYTIIAQASSSDGFSTNSQTFTIEVVGVQHYFTPGWFAPEFYAPGWFNGHAGP